MFISSVQVSLFPYIFGDKGGMIWSREFNLLHTTCTVAIASHIVLQCHSDICRVILQAKL